MKKTGLLLKEKRESLPLSLSEVALATKINPKILAAMENGDEARLPSKTFLKGFVRSYATFLKMDIEEVLRSYQEEMGSPPPVERVEEAAKTEATTTLGRRRVADENSSGLRTVAVVAIVILIGLIIGVRELIEKYQREKVLESSETIKVNPLELPPPEASAAAVVAPVATVAPVPNAPSAASTAATPTPAPTVAPTPPPVPTPTPVPAPAPAPAAVPAATPAVAPKPVPPPAPPPAPAVAPTPSPAAVKSVIILEALDKVEVKFKINGQSRRLVLAPLEVHTVHADHSVVFELSDGGAVNLIVDGRERGPPGELGKPKQVTLP